MNLSGFLLALYVFLQSAVYLAWFNVDDKLLGLIGLAFVIVWLLEAFWRPVTLPVRRHGE